MISSNLITSSSDVHHLIELRVGPFSARVCVTRTAGLLAQGVYLARRSRLLRRETELHETLLRLYRSPELLLRLTGSRLERE